MVPKPTSDAWHALTVIADVSATAMNALQQAVEEGNASAIAAMSHWLHRLAMRFASKVTWPVNSSRRAAARALYWLWIQLSRLWVQVQVVQRSHEARVSSSHHQSGDFNDWPVFEVAAGGSAALGVLNRKLHQFPPPLFALSDVSDTFGFKRNPEL